MRYNPGPGEAAVNKTAHMEVKFFYEGGRKMNK
jgi:hypothetical protein